MKIVLPFLLLFAVVSAVVCSATEQQQQQSSSGGSSKPGPIDLSMDLTADIEEPESRTDNTADSKSQLSGSASTQFATYSAASQAQVPEFGMRNPPSAKSTSGQQSGDHHQAFANYASEQAQMAFEPISAAYKSESNSGVANREFAQNVFRMTDSRQPVYESMNAESDQSYGQAQTVANEMDSPYYSKTTGQTNDNAFGSTLENGASDGFSPVAMSVDEAFRKYFPASKENDEPSASGDRYGQQQPQHQQQQTPQEPPRQTQYINTYASDPAENAQQQPPPQPTKEVFSIDSLREIVEKEPLARPDPFDPPSPPLSAFLPPPPEGAIPDSPPAQPSSSVPQFGNQQSQHQQQQQPEMSHNQQQYQPQQQQINSIQQHIQNMQQYAAPQQATSYVYKEMPAIESSAPTGTDHRHAQASDNDESEVSEEGEDEGLPYNTENLDDDGKKVSYVYSRPVRLPDVTKVVDGNGGSQYNREMEHIYRKPVSYENEEDNVDQNEQDGGAYGGLKQVTPQGYEEVTDKGAVSGGGAGIPYQQAMLSMPIGGLGQQMVTTYSDDGSYGGKAAQQLQPQHWTSGNDNRPEFVDQSAKDPNQPPQSIEYGGFVPIKKPGQHGGSPFQQSGDTVYLSDPKPGQQQQLPPKNFYPDHRPFHPMPHQNAPDHSGYVGPNNISPSGQAMPGHYSAPAPNGPPSKFGANVNNFLSKFPNLRFKPLYGKDAMKKLRELGISEDEFYGTVNKILQKSNGNGPRGGRPFYKNPMPYMPKANLYRSPPKNSHGPRQPMMSSSNNGANKMRPLGNAISDEFDFNYFKEGLPPGASYNPRDVGLDESVLAQIQLQDSGIGGYRFPTMIPTGTNIMPAVPSSKPYRLPGLPGFKKGPGPSKAPVSASSAYANSVPHAMNSMALPFVLTGPRPFAPRRVPYSATGKGFRSQYGYRAAASELKPQFVLPKPLKIFGQPVGLASASGASPLLGGGGVSLDDSASALGNIFGIRSIKGIKSLVSYLTGGVSG